METKDLHKQIAEKVKSTFLTVCYREWLYTPIPGWANKTPYQIIQEGKGDELVEMLNKVDEDFLEER